MNYEVSFIIQTGKSTSKQAQSRDDRSESHRVCLYNAVEKKLVHQLPHIQIDKIKIAKNIAFNCMLSQVLNDRLSSICGIVQ